MSVDGEHLGERISALLESSPLPPDPDSHTVESFVMDTYESAWSSHPRR